MDDLENIMLSEIKSDRKSEELYDNHMWAIKWKATNEQIRQTNKNS